MIKDECEREIPKRIGLNRLGPRWAAPAPRSTDPLRDPASSQLSISCQSTRLPGNARVRVCGSHQR